MNDFDAWNKQKKNIDIRITDSHPREGEIWWVCVGINVGAEIYGKGEFYLRPVLVINAEDHKRGTFIGVPLSSKLKTGVYACIIKTTDQRLHSVLTNQVRVFDRKRLWRLKYVLENNEYIKVKNIFDLIFRPKYLAV